MKLMTGSRLIICNVEDHSRFWDELASGKAMKDNFEA